MIQSQKLPGHLEFFSIKVSERKDIKVNEIASYTYKAA